MDTNYINIQDINLLRVDSYLTEEYIYKQDTIDNDYLITLHDCLTQSYCNFFVSNMISLHYYNIFHYYNKYPLFGLFNVRLLSDPNKIINFYRKSTMIVLLFFTIIEFLLILFIAQFGLYGFIVFLGVILIATWYYYSIRSMKIFVEIRESTKINFGNLNLPVKRVLEFQYFMFFVFFLYSLL